MTYKDANEALIYRTYQFRTAVQEAISDAKNIMKARADHKLKTQEESAISYQQTASGFLLPDFLHAIKQSSFIPPFATGFPLLDRELDGGFRSGLHGFGAVSSMGKTSLALQMCDHMAIQGHDVLYFTIEMAPTEIIAKILSRLTFLLAAEEKKYLAKTTTGILNGSRYDHYSRDEKELIIRALETYADYGRRIYVIEEQFSLNGGIGPDEIYLQVENHVETTGNRPAVLIDYLQILKPSDPHLSDKANIDLAVKKLKQLSRDFNVPVFIISSLNRNNYNQPVNMAAFKESGAIEYGTDTLIGVQAEGAGQPEFNIDRAKSQDPRKLELHILKNRNGPTGKIITLDYSPRFNYFEETGIISRNDFAPAVEAVNPSTPAAGRVRGRSRRQP